MKVLFDDCGAAMRSTKHKARFLSLSARTLGDRHLCKTPLCRYVPPWAALPSG